MQRRRLGCLVVGLVWTALFVFTLFGKALGDPAPIDCTGITNCDPYPTRWHDFLLPVELVLLVVIGWIFYRREMKDGDL